MWQPPVGGFWPLQRQVRKEGLGGPGGAADPENPCTQRGHGVRGRINPEWYPLHFAQYYKFSLLQLFDRDLMAQIQ
jgi:hypothetical protein